VIDVRLINADALIAEMHNVILEDGEDRRTFYEVIERQPTIEPERKTGKWIQFPNHMAYKCSECGRVIQTTDGQRNVSKHYPFCHCGAKMEAET
jgi:DNA-directed RNA polymerase subunit RPC12/RpoP